MKKRVQSEARVADIYSEARALSNELPKASDLKQGIPDIPIRNVLSPVAYAKAWAYFKEHPTISGLAKHMGWSQKKADRVVKVGYPEYGMIALGERLKDYVRNIISVIDSDESYDDVLRRESQEARMIQQRAFAVLRDALTSGTIDVYNEDGTIDPAKLRKIYDIYEKAGRFHSFVSGGADSRGELIVPAGILDEEELVENVIFAIGEAAQKAAADLPIDEAFLLEGIEEDETD